MCDARVWRQAAISVNSDALTGIAERATAATKRCRGLGRHPAVIAAGERLGRLHHRWFDRTPARQVA